MHTAVYGRDAQQSENGSTETELEKLHVVDLADGWTAISHEPSRPALHLQLSGRADLMESMCSSRLEMTAPSSPSREKFSDATVATVPTHRIIPQAALSVDDFPLYAAQLPELRDQRLLAQARVDNLRHKHSACCVFLDNDLRELLGALQRILPESTTCVNLHGLVAKFVEDTDRYQCQLSAARAAESDLHEIETQIKDRESQLFERLEILADGSAQTHQVNGVLH